MTCCIHSAAAARPGPVDKTSPNGSNPSEAGPSALDESTAMELYSQWLESANGARSAITIDNQGFANFKETLTRIEEINGNPGTQWTAGLNSGANLPASKHYPLMAIPFPPPSDSNATSSGRQGTKYTFPPTVDWVAAGKTTSVKAQGQCGACWAFSTLAAVESKLMILGGPATDLSEQALINCETQSLGCRGGYLSKGLDYVQNSGVPTESAVPYQETQNACTTAPPTVKISGWGQTQSQTASAIMAAVAKQPVTFIFDVAPDFTLYKSGVYSSDSCYRTGVGSGRAHAMTIVGYDSTADPPYWLVKNSWGAGDSWGMDGYAKIKMDPDGTPGQCSMYYYPMYYPETASLFVDSNGNGIDDSLEGIQKVDGGGNTTTGDGGNSNPTPAPVSCIFQGSNNFSIKTTSKVLKTLVTKDVDSCATATAANNGGSFNFQKKTKKCTVFDAAWDNVFNSLVPNKSMMAGYPLCTPAKKKYTKRHI